MNSRFRRLAPLCGNLASIDSRRAKRKKIRVRSENTRGKTNTSANAESTPKNLALRTGAPKNRRSDEGPRSPILLRVTNTTASHARRNTRWRIATRSRQAAGGGKRSQSISHQMMIRLPPRGHPQIPNLRTTTSEGVIPRQYHENDHPHNHSIWRMYRA